MILKFLAKHSLKRELHKESTFCNRSTNSFSESTIIVMHSKQNEVNPIDWNTKYKNL